MQEPAGADNQPQPEKLLAGKYRTPEDLEQGYANATRGYQQERRAREEAEARFAQLQAEYEAMRTNAVNPLRDQLTESGVNPDALVGVVRSEIQSYLGTALKPFADASKAQSDLEQMHEDFDLKLIQKAVAQDPALAGEYQTLLPTNPRAAYLMGYQAYRASKASQGPRTPVGAPDVVSAGNPRGQGGPGPAGDGELLTDQKYRELLAYAEDTGDYMPFLRARFEGTSVGDLAKGEQQHPF